MNDFESVRHPTWICKYHVVFIPKCRRKAVYQELLRHLGEVFRKLALQKESNVEEGKRPLQKGKLSQWFKC
jgi:putative transposase